jgi:hypothetical protein
LHPVKKIVIMVCFTPMARCVLGMTYVGDDANIFEDGEEYRSQDSSPVAIPSNGALRKHVQFVVSLLMLQHGALLSRRQNMGHPVP